MWKCAVKRGNGRTETKHHFTEESRWEGRQREGDQIGLVSVDLCIHIFHHASVQQLSLNNPPLTSPSTRQLLIRTLCLDTPCPLFFLDSSLISSTANTKCHKHSLPLFTSFFSQADFALFQLFLASIFLLSLLSLTPRIPNAHTFFDGGEHGK